MVCLPMQETWIRYLGQEDTLEKKMATYSSILVWKIQYSCLENPMDSGAWLATYSPWGHKIRHERAGMHILYIK